MRNVAEIIKDAGGPRAIHEASNGSVKKDAVYKWQHIGVPDRHWPILIELAGATPEELFEANRMARDASPPAREKSGSGGKPQRDIQRAAS